MKWFFRLGLVAVCTVCFACRPAQGSQELHDKLNELAAAILQATKGQPVKVGVFSPTDLPHTNTGPGLEGVLSTMLERHSDGIVRSDAAYEVKGDYAFAKSRLPQHAGLKLIKIKVRIIEIEFASDVLELPLEVVVENNKSIAEILQVTASLDPRDSRSKRNRRLDELTKNPEVFIHGNHTSLISSSKNSPFAIELLAKPLKGHEHLEAQPRPARADADIKGKKGLAVVDIQRNDLYEVRVHNNSDEEIAVSMTVDGLDVFHFTKDRDEHGQPAYTHFIIPAHSSSDIIGWHNSVEGDKNYLSFLVTAYGQGAASQEGISARDTVGVIHVQFAKCYPLQEGMQPKGSNETGFGPPRSRQDKVVRYEIEPPDDFVSVRYTR